MVLIELLALALLINAAAILLVLRPRSAPPAATTAGASTSVADVQVREAEMWPASGGAVDAAEVSFATDLVELASLSASARAEHLAGSRWAAPDQATWAERVRAEGSRARRYGRQASIVAFRIHGLDGLAASAGPEVVTWVREGIVRRVQTFARESDLAQSDGHDRIRVLLVEADDEAARAFADRVTRTTVGQFPDPRAPLRLEAGWASTGLDSDLEASDRLAHAHLAD